MIHVKIYILGIYYLYIYKKISEVNYCLYQWPVNININYLWLKRLDICNDVEKLEILAKKCNTYDLFNIILLKYSVAIKWVNTFKMYIGYVVINAVRLVRFNHVLKCQIFTSRVHKHKHKVSKQTWLKLMVTRNTTALPSDVTLEASRNQMWH